MKRRASCFESDDSEKEEEKSSKAPIPSITPSFEDPSIYLYDEYLEETTEKETKQKGQESKFAHKFIAAAKERKDRYDQTRQKQIESKRIEKIIEARPSIPDEPDEVVIKEQKTEPISIDKLAESLTESDKEYLKDQLKLFDSKYDSKYLINYLEIVQLLIQSDITEEDLKN